MGLAAVDPDAVWIILAKLAWEGGTFQAPKAPDLKPGVSDLFPPRTALPAKPTPLATVAAALIEKVNRLVPPWLEEAATD